MKRIILLLAGVMAPLFMLASSGVNLSDAVAKGTVKLDAVTIAGKYTGRSLRLLLINTANSTVELKVNTGVILRPADQAYTQLVLPGGESVTIKAHETAELDVQVFSNNAVKLCPADGQHYTYFRVCGEELMAVLEYVRAHAIYGHLGQAAVWSISNYLAFNCVYDRDKPQESESLIARLVAITRRDKPTYYTPYIDVETPGQRAYKGQADKIYVPFELNLPEPRRLSLAVYNDKGALVKSISEQYYSEPGKHTFTADITPADFEKGKYSVRVMDGDKTLHERTVMVESWITFKG